MSGDEERSVVALDTNTFVEDRPGTILYEDWGPYETWRSDKKWSTQNLSAESQFISYDVDMDGADELLFISRNGTLIVLDVPSGAELLKMTVARYNVWGSYLAVGNLDGDVYKEIVLYNGTALICVDFKEEVVLWTSDVHLTTNPYRAQGPITLVDPDGDGIDEILVRTNTNYYHLDNKGGIVHNVSLALWGDSMPGDWSYLGWPTRMIVEDLDGDGDLEVFMSGWGWSMKPEILNQGRQFWIIDLATGNIEFSHQFNDTIFYSDPVLFDHDGDWYIAIGLWDYYGGKELLIIDHAGRNWEMVDVCATSSMCTAWLTIIPDEDDTILFLSTNQSWAMAWSYCRREILWMYPRGAELRLMESTPITCDIDGDGEWEVLVPIATVHVFDAATGEEEFEFDSPPGIVIYNDERTGIGDYDGDGYTEVCQGVKYWDEEYFKIYYIDTDVLDYEIEIQSEGPLIQMYAGIENRLSVAIVNMTERRLPSSLVITFFNDPWDTVAEYTLCPSNGTFEAPYPGLIGLSGYTVVTDGHRIYLNLSLVPSWEFDYEGPNHLDVSFVSLMGTKYQRTFDDLFSVEDDLVLSGNAEIRWRGETIGDGDWIIPDQAMEITKLDVLYEGSDGIHPPRDSFILIYSDGNVMVNHSFEEGEQMTVGATSPVADGDYPVSLRVYQLPVGRYGGGAYNITLRVDGTNPYEGGHFPDNSSWFCDNNVALAILLMDDGSGIDPLQVEYCWVRDVNRIDKMWQHATPDDMTEVDGGVLVQLEMPFGEGTTFVLWRFSDHLDHRATFNHTINVDLQGISFHDFAPVGWWNIRHDHIPVSINVSDEGGSGINESSIEWSYSHSDLLSLSQWTPVQLTEHQGTYTVHMNYTGLEGTTNLIRFRGRDMAGNQALSSRVYVVWIDTTPPEVTLLTDTSYLLDPALDSLRVMITDGNSGVTERVGVTIFNIGAGTEYHPGITIVESSIHSMTIDLALIERNGTEYRINIEAWDVAGNRLGASRWFDLDQPPVITEILPEDGASFIEGTAIEFSVTWEEPNGEEPSIEWWDGDTLLSEEAVFNLTSLPVGEHDVSVTIQDSHHEVTERVSFEITERPEEPIEPPSPEDPSKPVVDDDILNPLWVLIIIVIIVMAALLVSIYLRRDQTKDNSDE